MHRSRQKSSINTLAYDANISISLILTRFEFPNFFATNGNKLERPKDIERDKNSHRQTL
jgi:hypothetical protein